MAIKACVRLRIRILKYGILAAIALMAQFPLLSLRMLIFMTRSTSKIRPVKILKNQLLKSISSSNQAIVPIILRVFMINTILAVDLVPVP